MASNIENTMTAVATCAAAMALLLASPALAQAPTPSFSHSMTGIYGVRPMQMPLAGPYGYGIRRNYNYGYAPPPVFYGGGGSPNRPVRQPSRARGQQDFAYPRYGTDAAAAGVAGLAPGATVGAQIPLRTSRESAGIVPWTADWQTSCTARYRSFNPQTGYFRGYDGRHHFCR